MAPTWAVPGLFIPFSILPSYLSVRHCPICDLHSSGRKQLLILFFPLAGLCNHCDLQSNRRHLTFFHQQSHILLVPPPDSTLKDGLNQFSSSEVFEFRSSVLEVTSGWFFKVSISSLIRASH